MRKIIGLIALFGCFQAGGQNITSLEYFTDTDPGYGRATKITITAGENITQQINLSSAPLSPGIHLVGYRAMNSLGRWSHTREHSFFVMPDPTVNLVAAEYFVDIDPGEGKATALPTGIASGTINPVIPLTSLEKGFHLLGFRIKNDKNVWSHTREHFVHVETNAGKQFTRVEYFYSGGGANASLKYTYTVPTPFSNVSLNFRTDLSQLLPDSNYVLNMVAITEDGTRTQTVTKAFKVNAVVTAVNEVMADGFVLRQNFPNPVQQTTTFSFNLPVSQVVRLSLFDQNGKKLEQLFNARLNPGKHLVQKNLQHLPSGIYTVVFQSEKYLLSMKLVR